GAISAPVVQYENNNMLHLHIYTREVIVDDVGVIYCIMIVKSVMSADLVDAVGADVIVGDRDWQLYYEGRTHHPPSEAEKAFIDVMDGGESRVRMMGKHLDPSEANLYLCTEFLGLWKMSAAGARAFRAHFESLDKRLAPSS